MTTRGRTVLALLIATLTATAAPAQQTSGPSALVVFPHIVIDASRDTVVQLVNATDQPVEVRCLYEDLTPECLGAGTCLPYPPTCDNGCVPRAFQTAFRIRLTPDQPLGWSVARGLSELPLDGEERTGALGETNVGTYVPPVSRELFQGTLRCVVVDERGRPTDVNALAGSASIETRATSTSPRIDAAQYSAVGLAAFAGANDGDAFLRLGGVDAEYGACPATLMLLHTTDLAIVRTGVGAGTVTTTVALVPCGGDPLLGDGQDLVLQMLVYNEYQQRFSTSRVLSQQLVLPLSFIDTNDPTRSIFSAGVLGTVTAQTNFTGIAGDSGPHAVLGVATTAYRDLQSGGLHHSSVRFGSEGTSAAGHLLAISGAPCVGDCDGGGEITINELIVAINVGLGGEAMQACPAVDSNGSRTAGIDELLQAVLGALNGCPQRVAPTEHPGVTPSPTPMSTPPTALGPDITFLGIASGDDAPQAPVDVDDEGRPIYMWPVGQGFSLVVEARPGSNASRVGTRAASASEEDLPDLQVIVSRPLGDGNPTVCDADPPNLGGVPAAVPFEFSGAPEVVRAINDLGCRTDDGRGEPSGRVGSIACTRIAPENRVHFVTDASRLQFCVPIARAWAFPEGDTTVAVQLRDIAGFTGPPREIVIRIPATP